MNGRATGRQATRTPATASSPVATYSLFNPFHQDNHDPSSTPCLPAGDAGHARHRSRRHRRNRRGRRGCGNHRRGDAAVAAYDPANRLATASELSSLYFEVFEGSGMELDLGIRSPSLKNELEVLFGVVNGQAMRGVAAADLNSSWLALRGRLNVAAALYDTPETDGFLPTLLKSALILIREGWKRCSSSARWPPTCGVREPPTASGCSTPASAWRFRCRC
jgi:hypothetical protein